MVSSESINIHLNYHHSTGDYSGFCLITLFSQSGLGAVIHLNTIQTITAIIIMTAGTIFHVAWRTHFERKIGNGISLIIFAGIVATLPQTIQRTLYLFDKTQLTSLIVFLVISLVTIIAVVYRLRATQYSVSYARNVRGMGKVFFHCA